MPSSETAIVGFQPAAFPGVYENSSDIVTLSRKHAASLVTAAKASPRGRARLLLHRSRDDTLHEMLIALPASSCDIPHLNFKSGKSFHVVEGTMAVVVCSRDGGEITAHLLSDHEPGLPYMLRLNSPSFHTIIPLTGYAVFVEIISGPFQGNQFVEWAGPDPRSGATPEAAAKIRAAAMADYEAYKAGRTPSGQD
jgi:cupin fold WbuC family metalloprotein